MQNNTDNTKYAGAFEYNSGNYLTRIGTEEEQITIVNNGANATDYSFDYYLRDHLGNTRMVLNEAGAIVQETEYMPFGLAIEKIAGSNKYLYNEKEKQPETGYLDYGARQYDPSIGRWMVVDPMAEKYFDLSPYNYVANNPIRFIDPEGLDIWINYGDNQRARYENGKLYNEDGSAYEGKNAFVNTITKNLNKMNSTEIGKGVLSSLSGSKNDFSFVNQTEKNAEGQEIQSLSYSAAENGGGIISAGFLMSKLGKQSSQEGSNVESTAHELFHAYQDENGEGS